MKFFIEHKKHILTALVLLTITTYLFATRPVPLAEAGGDTSERIPTQVFLQILAAENSAIRNLYTSQIVGPGLKQGLKFREDWKDKTSEAGPLPALFLREMSTIMQRDASDIGLFLGSDFPIVSANLFKGLQKTEFEKLKSSKQAQFFLDSGSGRYTAMYPDYASSKACVTCHNEHPKTPKKDWELNGIMGATTWSYPRKEVSVAEVLRYTSVLRAAALETYGLYLTKLSTFKASPVPAIAAQWPKDGMFVPTLAEMKKTIETQNNALTFQTLLDARATRIAQK
jgi:adenylate cyclase